jgi:toxin ParE1/3/4
MKRRWQVSLTEAAGRDFVNILHWTSEHFGKGQARAYEKTLRVALQDLVQGPGMAGCQEREDIGPGIFGLHVARKGRKGRHFVMFRADAAAGNVEVLRLLHDSMDFARHLVGDRPQSVAGLLRNRDQKEKK